MFSDEELCAIVLAIVEQNHVIAESREEHAFGLGLDTIILR